MGIDLITKDQIWGKKWLQLKKIDSGGQGYTYLSKNIDNSEQNLYVLKILKDQKNPERRKRMFREVSAYKTLKHSGIPKFIGSNVDDFEKNNIELFLIAEYIPGDNLEKYIRTRERLELNDAIKIILKLLEIVEFCHNNDTIHRDIKPDNIILKNNNLNKVFLVDFGLSFNKSSDAEENLSTTSQQLGNRFLYLPELSGYERKKQDARADITQCCGIFFYILTKQIPRSLLDQLENKPHQRVKAQNILSALPPKKREKLFKIFDIGFEQHIDRRFQSVESLKKSIKDLLNVEGTKSTDPSPQKLNNFLQKAHNNLDFQKKSEIKILFDKIDEATRQTVERITAELGKSFARTQSGLGFDMALLTQGDKVGIINQIYPNKEIKPIFRYSITGSEIVITATEDDQEVEILRAPYSGFNLWDDLRVEIERYFHERIDRLL